MASIEDLNRKHVATVQEAVPDEQVLAVGVLSRPGSIGAGLATQVSGLLATVMSKKGKDASGGLPLNVVVAATPTRLLAFDFKPKGASIKLRQRVAEWPRAGMQVTTEKKTTATRLTFQFGDGTRIELDSNRQFGGANAVNDAFIAEVSSSQPT